MNAKTILFLAANASFSHTNLAGGYLGAVAAAAGWRWHTLEMLDATGMPVLLEAMDRYRPRVLAASFYLFNRQRLLELIRRCKAMQPECVVIGGGPEFDGDNRSFLAAEPSVDLVVRGEGEQALRDWLAIFDKRDRWHEVPGLCLRRKPSGYHDGGWAVPVPDMDLLPSPYDHLADFTRKPFLQLETTRGCGNACTFCCSGHRKGLRMFSMVRVRKELKKLQAAGVRAIRILDRTFNERPGRAARLLNMMIDEFSAIRFHLEIDPGRLTPICAATLARAPAGQFHLETGIQTLQPAVWKRIHRGSNPRRTLTGLQTLTAMPNVVVHADLIAGLPGAGLQALREDIDTLVNTGPAEIQLEILKILPGTRLWETAARERIVHAPDPPYEVLRTDAMPPAGLAVATAWSRVIDWFYNPAPLRATCRTAAQRFADFWDRALVVVLKHAPGSMGTPALRNRFLWLAELVAGAPDLVDALRFSWMEQGLGERAGFIAPRPWRGTVPAGAELVRGTIQADATSIRRAWIRLDCDYIFEYHADAANRRTVTVFRLPGSAGGTRLS